MAILVAAPGDPASTGSPLEDAAARLCQRVSPRTERVWTRLAAELRIAGFRHLGEVDTGCASDLGGAGRALVAEIKAAQVAQRQAYAQELITIADLAALAEAQRPFERAGSASRVTAGEHVAQVVAFELGISTPAAMDRLGRAWALQRLPRTLAALSGGWLGVGAVNALIGATAGVALDKLDAVEARVFDALGARRLPDGSDPLGAWAPRDLEALLDRLPHVAGDLDAVSTPGWVKTRCRSAVKAVDPEALKRQVKAARSRRSVRVWDAAEPGMAWLGLLTTQAEAAACYRRIAAEAVERHRACEAQELVDTATGELPTLANTRADVMVDQLLGPRPDGTPGPPINLTVHVVPDAPERPDGDGDGGGRPVPLPDPQGSPTGNAATPSIPAGEARVDSLGEVVRAALDDLVHLAVPAGAAGALRRGSGRVRLRMLQPAVCRGHDAGLGPGPYRPGADLVAQVVARDQTCRFPGCAVPAQNCDLDHSVPWPIGPTCPCNLVALCRRHHRVKTHHRGWTVTHHGVEGRITWTTPGGRTIDTHPGRGSP